MAGIYHPSRGGVRGGQDQFQWEDVKTDKDRECYLGHSVMVPVGKWQEGKDLIWYTRDNKKKGSNNMTVKEQKENNRKQELQSVKDIEARAMQAALGHKSFSMGTTSLTAKELQEVLSRGQTEHMAGDKIQGMGYKKTSKVNKQAKYGTEFEGGDDSNKKEDEEDTSMKSSKKKKKKDKKTKKKKKKKRHESDNDFSSEDEHEEKTRHRKFDGTKKDRNIGSSKYDVDTRLDRKSNIKRQRQNTCYDDNRESSSERDRYEINKTVRKRYSPTDKSERRLPRHKGDQYESRQKHDSRDELDTRQEKNDRNSRRRFDDKFKEMTSRHHTDNHEEVNRHPRDESRHQIDSREKRNGHQRGESPHQTDSREERNRHPREESRHQTDSREERNRHLRDQSRHHTDSRERRHKSSRHESRTESFEEKTVSRKRHRHDSSDSSS